MNEDRVLIVEITGYYGDTTSLETDPDPQFAISDLETGELIDCGYYSYEHALRYYPNAINKRVPDAAVSKALERRGVSYRLPRLRRRSELRSPEEPSPPPSSDQG